MKLLTLACCRASLTATAVVPVLREFGPLVVVGDLQRLPQVLGQVAEEPARMVVLIDQALVPPKRLRGAIEMVRRWPTQSGLSARVVVVGLKHDDRAVIGYYQSGAAACLRDPLTIRSLHQVTRRFLLPESSDQIPVQRRP